MANRSQIIAAARRWLGTPYHHEARLLGQGVDCAQLLYAVFVEDTGIVPPFDIEHYPSDWMMHRSEERFLGYLQEHADRVDTPLPGDIVMYQWGRCYAHGAVVLEWPQIIHADIRAGRVVISDGNVGRFESRAAEYFRVRGLA